MLLQRRTGLALPQRAEAAGLGMIINPPDRRRRAHLEPPPRRSARSTRRNLGYHQATKIIRIGSPSHVRLQIRGSMDSQSNSNGNPHRDHNRFIRAGECSSGPHGEERRHSASKTRVNNALMATRLEPWTRTLCSFPSFETPASRAPQDEDRERLICN
jgi:hypothetical protein